MNEHDTSRSAQSGHSLISPEHVQDLVRLFQCAKCLHILREPMILPCGNSICKSCIPTSHEREGVSWPQDPNRVDGFICPLPTCAHEHPVADCSLDVTLSKIVELIKAQIGQDTAIAMTTYEARRSETPTINIDVSPSLHVRDSGHIVAAFNFAEEGNPGHHTDLNPDGTSLSAEQLHNVRAMDEVVATNIREIVRGELECTVCYGLMVDPLTTGCGHTFCRKCVARVLDHSRLCPACRRELTVRPGNLHEPSNQRLKALTEALLGEDLAARIIAVQQEETFDDNTTPLFPCTLAFPGQPTFLHIFEPRYRLMVRRAMENGSRKFGMMMYNPSREPQGELGPCVFKQYGTMLSIERIELIPDGRSLLETQGLYRFKVLSHGMMDGYTVGRIERLDDIPLAEEEAQEALERSGPAPEEDDFEGQLLHMSTQELLQYNLSFITQARARSASWLHQRILLAYGQPPTDAAMFPFWFASVLPIRDNQKYSLLPLTSVRERLKLTARWIKALEEARCAHLAAMRRFATRAWPVEPPISTSETPSTGTVSAGTSPRSERAEVPRAAQTVSSIRDTPSSEQEAAPDVSHTTNDANPSQRSSQSPHPQ